MQGILLVSHIFKGSILDQNYVGVELQFSTVSERFSIDIETRSYGTSKVNVVVRVRYQKGRFKRIEDETNAKIADLVKPLLEARTYESVEQVAVNVADYFNE